jgi:hypothetical protein
VQWWPSFFLLANPLGRLASRNRLWMSNLRGFVYKVSPGDAAISGLLETGVLCKLRGTYWRLSYSDGCLWGTGSTGCTRCP